jgi:hypothetical protein
MSRSDHGIRLRIFIGSTCQREGMGIFGGGCGFWSAIYIVEQNRLMSLQPDSDATVVCNSRK